MRVENDFPKADKVLRNLRYFVSHFTKKLEEEKNKPETEKNEREIKKCEIAIRLASDYTSAIANYLDSVCNAEIRIAKARIEEKDPSEIRELIAEEDRVRTNNHSDVIFTMVKIDNFADMEKLDKVFDFAGEFYNDYNVLMPQSIDEKKRMSEAARIKRREMGNFGLYIAATVTAGMDMEHMITDDEARNFASCEGELQKTDDDTYMKIRASSGKVKRNMENILE